MIRKHHKSSLLVIFLSILFNLFYTSSDAIIRSEEGTVVSVSDGDTFKLETFNGTKLKLRCYGYDSPEVERINRKTGQVSKPGQSLGKESYQALRAKIYGKKVKIDIIDIDRYKRMVSIVYLNGRVINWEMVREGMGECYMDYLKEPYKAQCLQAEKEAKHAKRGIWGLPNYEAPSEFRKRMRIRGK